MSIISIKDLIKHEDDVLEKYPMLKLLRDIVTKYPDVKVEPCFHWYKTDNGLTVLKGYHVNFGIYTLSVQFGYGNYRTGYNGEKLKTIGLVQDEYLKNAIDAEIAVINHSKPYEDQLTYFNNWGGDNVLGYQTPEQIMNFIDEVLAPKLGSGE